MFDPALFAIVRFSMGTIAALLGRAPGAFIALSRSPHRGWDQRSRAAISAVLTFGCRCVGEPMVEDRRGVPCMVRGSFIPGGSPETAASSSLFSRILTLSDSPIIVDNLG
jgi:hypothetical protein